MRRDRRLWRMKTFYENEDKNPSTAILFQVSVGLVQELPRSKWGHASDFGKRPFGCKVFCEWLKRVDGGGTAKASRQWMADGAVYTKLLIVRMKN